jgi:hypothetical protein
MHLDLAAQDIMFGRICAIDPAPEYGKRTSSAGYRSPMRRCINPSREAAYDRESVDREIPGNFLGYGSPRRRRAAASDDRHSGLIFIGHTA